MTQLMGALDDLRELAIKYHSMLTTRARYKESLDIVRFNLLPEYLKQITREYHPPVKD